MPKTILRTKVAGAIGGLDSGLFDILNNYKSPLLMLEKVKTFAEIVKAITLVFIKIEFLLPDELKVIIKPYVKYLKKECKLCDKIKKEAESSTSRSVDFAIECIDDLTKINDSLNSSKVAQFILLLAVKLCKYKVTKKSFEEKYNERLPLDIFSLIQLDGTDENLDFMEVLHHEAICYENKQAIYLLLCEIKIHGKKLKACVSDSCLDIEKIFATFNNIFDKLLVGNRSAARIKRIINPNKDILKKNFDIYYSKVQQTNNPALFFTSYVGDVMEDMKEKRKSNADIMMLKSFLFSINETFKRSLSTASDAIKCKPQFVEAHKKLTDIIDAINNNSGFDPPSESELDLFKDRFM